MKIFDQGELFVDGILLVNKPGDITSHRVTQKIKNHFKLNKVGHGGTLDPFATGMLVILIGKATRISKFFLFHEKSYYATMVLGASTDTYDLSGKITKTLPAQHVTEMQIKEVFKLYEGKIKQRPPIFSAIKIKGKKAYELARKGEHIELQKRDAHIYKLKLIKTNNENSHKVFFETRVSKGTYIRSLANDIGQTLGVGAYLEELVRTRSGSFDIKNAYDLEDILNWDQAKLQNNSLKIHDALDLPSIKINNKLTIKKIKNGQGLDSLEIDETVRKAGTIKILAQNGDCLALHKIKGNETKAEVVF